MDYFGHRLFPPAEGMLWVDGCYGDGPVGAAGPVESGGTGDRTEDGMVRFLAVEQASP